MAMVGVVSDSLYRRTHSLTGLVLGRRPLGAILHSSNEPGELSQWLCHDGSTINIVVLIIIIIIIVIVSAGAMHIWIIVVVVILFIHKNVEGISTVARKRHKQTA